MKDKLSFWKDNLAALGMIAGVLMTVIGGTMAILGGYVGFTVHDAIRWDGVTGEVLGNMTGNTTQFTVTWEPIDTASNGSVTKIRVFNKSSCTGSGCYTGAGQIVPAPCGGANGVTCYTIDDSTLGTLTVNMSNLGNVPVSQINSYVITADYTGVKSGTDLSNVYSKIMKALVILGVAFIVVGAGVIFRELSNL